MSLEEFLKRASVFQRPEDLGKLLEQYRAGIARDELFNNPRHQPVLESWQATLLGIGYEDLTRKPVEIRLCHPEPFPDFQLRSGTRVFDFEATLYSEKKLGEEYRGDGTIGPPSVARPHTLPPFDGTPITDAVARKAGRHYGPNVHLLVHLNYGGRDASYEEARDAVTRGGGNAFESVWLLAGGYLACAKPSSGLARLDGWLKISIEDLDGQGP